MDREFLENLRVGEQALPGEMVDSILQAHQKALQDWQDKYDKAQTLYREELDGLRFDTLVKEAVGASRGRNLKAITALMDLDALKEHSDPTGAVYQAVAKLKKEHGYLFLTEAAQPPYAQGAGTTPGDGDNSPNTLAGALRERFKGDL